MYNCVILTIQHFQIGSNTSLLVKIVCIKCGLVASVGLRRKKKVFSLIVWVRVYYHSGSLLKHNLLFKKKSKFRLTTFGGNDITCTQLHTRIVD